MGNRTMRIVLAMLVLYMLMIGGLLSAVAQGPDGAHATATPGAVSGQGSRSGAEAAFEPGEVLVRLKDDLPNITRLRMPAQYQATKVRSLLGSDVELWQVPAGQELAAIKELSADPRVDYAEPNFVYQAFFVPNDPRLSKQWAHTLLKSPMAWDVTTGSAGMTIAVIDSGIDLEHPDLVQKLVSGYDFVDGSKPWDDHGHGTQVAGVAAAATNNGVGVAGMDWQARIMPVRVLDETGLGSLDSIADGVHWAYRHGAKVLNLSLGSTSDAQTLRLAVADAHSAGALVIASMGNCRIQDQECPVANPTHYPAAYDTVMAVAATTRYDGYAYYSQRGSHCDISAPGGDITLFAQDGIISTLPTYEDFYLRTNYGYARSYDYGQGTSLAAPYVAGLASLIWAANPTLAPDQVRSIIQNTAEDLGTSGWDPDFGHGRINALAAIQAVAIPAAPILLPIDNEDGDGVYRVKWDSVANTTGYVLEEDNHPSFPSPMERYRGTATRFQASGQGPGAWYYRVRAYNDVGSGPWSNVQVANVPPVAPALNPIVNSGQDEYEVTWQPSKGATSYTLEEADNSSFDAPIVRYSGVALEYRVTGQKGGVWYYRVRARNVAGDGPWCEQPRHTTVDPAALSPPNLRTISNSDGDGSYLVDWTNVSGATSYALEESSNPYFDHPTEVYTGSRSEFSVTQQAGSVWYYRVRAHGSAGKSPWSQQRSVVVTSWLYLPFMAQDSGWDNTEK